MKELIRQISQSLVDNADKVEVTEVIGDQSYIIELRVAKEGCRESYWEAGRTAQAIRTILSALSAKHTNGHFWKF